MGAVVVALVAGVLVAVPDVGGTVGDAVSSLVCRAVGQDCGDGGDAEAAGVPGDPAGGDGAGEDGDEGDGDDPADGGDQNADGDGGDGDQGDGGDAEGDDGGDDGDDGGGGLFGGVGDFLGDVADVGGDALAWTSDQLVGFGKGFVDGVVGMGEGLWTLYQLSPNYALMDPDGWVENWQEMGQVAQFAWENPGEFGKALINWEDLSEGRYGEWLGNLAPDVILTIATAGGGSAAVAGNRGVKAVDALEDLGDLADAARTADRLNPTGSAGVAGVDDAARAADRLRLEGAMRDINPGFGQDPLRGTNCTRCVVALDHTLDGAPAQALPSRVGTLGDVQRHFGGTFRRAGTDPAAARTSIEQELLAAGPGSRGVVAAARNGQPGHVFNAVNENGVVYFLDGQTGTWAKFNDGTYVSYQFLRTN